MMFSDCARLVSGKRQSAMAQILARLPDRIFITQLAGIEAAGN
jgi:hypothetical protein